MVQLCVDLLYLLFVALSYQYHTSVGAESKETRTRNYEDNNAKVLILGAGASGLQAARYLHDNGVDDFMIIEGADYIGGRIHNVPFAGVKVELGANCAQPGNTGIVEQVKSLGIETHLSNFDSLVIRNITGYDLSEQADWEGLEKAMEKTSKIARDIVKNNKPDMSQRAALRLSGWIPRRPIDHAIEYFEYDFEWADIPAVTSLQSTALLNYATDILFVKDPRGFQYIFNDIVGFLQDDPYLNHIRLNKTVKSVDQSSDDKVTVTCEDGTVYTGDYVLVTFGLGVMQEGLVEFNPPLPNWKIEELFQFIMTSFTKIFLKWPFKFWDDEEWIIHANERRGFYPVFLNLEADNLFPKGTNILVAFVTGDEARRVESQSDAETKAEIEQVLRSIYGAEAVPHAKEILISGWNRNPLHRGAYSNWPVEVSVECFQKMQARVGRLFFGGEHTDEVYNGYVVGAQRSGEREAKKILKCLSDVCDESYPRSIASHTAQHIIILLLAVVTSLLATLISTHESHILNEQ